MQGSKCLTGLKDNTTVRQNQASSFRESTEGLFDFACNSSVERKSFFYLPKPFARDIASPLTCKKQLLTP